MALSIRTHDGAVINLDDYIAAHAGGGNGIQTAVVDIGPHLNTGPGDQTKGILDWSANPIIIVAGVAGKYPSLISWDYDFQA